MFLTEYELSAGGMIKITILFLDYPTPKVYYIIRSKDGGGTVDYLNNAYKMTELEAITERHSVRSYKNKRIEPEKIDIIKEKIDALNSEYDLHMQFVRNAGEVFSGIASRFTGWSGVPSYIALIGRKRPELDELCGYCGEQLVLLAQKLGLNTCWAGIFKRKKVRLTLAEDERLVLVIAIGYGADGGKPRRSKPVDMVTDVPEKDMPDWFRCGVTAALLAPTAMNQQKFMFSLDGDTPTARISDSGYFDKVDLGIAKYHFEAATGRKVK